MEFHWPVGDEYERTEFGKLPGAWIAATKYAQRYDATGKWAIHTGLDLNLNTPRFDADAHSPVYAAENGVVEFAGKLPVWGSVIILKHTSESLSELWTRYAHVEQMRVAVGNLVERGRQIAQVGNADGRYPYHLHYDIARKDLGETPGDWPGDKLAAVLRDYRDPLAFMRDQLARASGFKKTRVLITAQPNLRVRQDPMITDPVVGRVNYGEVVELVAIENGFGRIETPMRGWIMLSWTRPAS